LARAQTTAPLFFVQNVGQFDSRARFQAQAQGTTIYLADDGIWLTLLERSPPRGPGKGAPWAGGPLATQSLLNSMAAGVNLKLSFVGANPHPTLEPFGPLSTHVSYLRGKDQTGWHADVPVWSGVRYHNLFPGADLEILGTGGHFQWRLVSSSGNSASTSSLVDIERNTPLRIDGADAASLTRDGLLITTIAGELRLPLIRVPSATETLSPPTLAFTHGGYLVSTPFSGTLSEESARSTTTASTNGLTFSTYLGGSSNDEGVSIAIDTAGNSYVAGYTSSADFPTTPGAFSTTCVNYCTNWEAFISKIDPTGSTLVYSTFLGGTVANGTAAPYSQPAHLAIDKTGDAYIAGTTTTTDFPTTPGALQTSGGNEASAFVTELNATGSALVYSTYLSGHTSGTFSQAYGIALDNNNDAFVTGQTNAPDFPTTPGAYQTTIGTSLSAFVTELNAAGSNVIYSTYFGGGDLGSGIVVDGEGNAYVTGQTPPGWCILTPGAYRTTSQGAAFDAFVFKLNPIGTALVYSTCLGGSAVNNLVWYGLPSIEIDGNGNAYITGATQDSLYPTTPGAFQSTYPFPAGSINVDAFVTKLDPSGSALVYSTFLGGLTPPAITNVVSNSVYGIAIDSAGYVYVTGTTDTVDFPTSPGAFETSPSYDGSYANNAFVTKLNTLGTALTYSTYIGSGSTDGNAVTVDTTGDAFITGYTAGGYPTTVGAFQTNASGGWDAFVTELMMGNSPQPTQTPIATSTPTSLSSPTAISTTTATPTSTATVTPTGTPSSATCLLADFCNILFNQNDYKGIPYGGSRNNYGALTIPFAFNYVNSYGTETDYISDWGCDVTSVAMILNYYSRIQGNIFYTDPDDLNTWLQENGGYLNGVPLNSTLITNLPDPPYSPDPSGQYYGEALVKYDYATSYANLNNVSVYALPETGPQSTATDSVLNTSLANKNPVLLNVTRPGYTSGHWVVALAQTTHNGTVTWQIYDPDPKLNIPQQSITTLDQGYGNTYAHLVPFSQTPVSTLRIYGDPVQMLLIDSLGRETGVDPATGSMLSQIPGSSYLADTKASDTTGATLQQTEIDVQAAATGTYSLQVIGTQTGQYSVDLVPDSANGMPGSTVALAGAESPDSTSSYSFSYSATGGNSQIGLKYEVFLPIVLNTALP